MGVSAIKFLSKEPGHFGRHKTFRAKYRTEPVAFFGSAEKAAVAYAKMRFESPAAGRRDALDCV
jgi:hypothetical protein